MLRSLANVSVLDTWITVVMATIHRTKLNVLLMKTAPPAASMMFSMATLIT